MQRRTRLFVLRGAALAAFAFVLVPAAPASAGRLLATGHDVESHCVGSTPDTSQCGFMRVATNYVRGGAPIPTKPVLALDCGTNVAGALDSALGVNAVPRVTKCPTTAADGFATEPLTTDRYSAILVGSSCDSLNFSCSTATPESNAINARKAAITAFFNAGGGIFAMAGDVNGDGDATTGPETYYGFISLPLGGKQVTAPFCLTAAGRALGLQDAAGCPDVSQRTGTRDDINCCPTHNSFQQPPAGSALVAAERDVGTDGVLSATDAPETLIAEGIASGNTIVTDADKDGVPDNVDTCPSERGPAPSGCPAPVLGVSFNAEVVKGSVFVSVPTGTALASQNLTVPGLKGRTFIPLAKARNLPVGSFLDTRKGAVRLKTARNSKGAVQSGVFTAGVFKVVQSRKKRAKGLTTLKLKGSSFKRCSSSRRSSVGAQAAARSRRTVRRVRGNAKGRFRTQGKYSSATVRGTKWLVSDRCDGTLTKVSRGKVAVRDFRRHKTILLRSGKRYLARRR